MAMTPEEIAREYRLSADRKKQVAILADENMTTRAEIIRILKAQGEQADARWAEKAKPAGGAKKAPEPKGTAVLKLAAADCRRAAAVIEARFMELIAGCGEARDAMALLRVADGLRKAGGGRYEP